MKKCTKCQNLKELVEFNKRKESKDGLGPHCKECRKATRKEELLKHPERKDYWRAYREKHKDKTKENKKQWASNNKDKVLGHTLKYHYGMTAEQYYEMNTKQENKCKICLKIPENSRLCVDHCHKTGKIRGLLCHQCNRAIGLLGDNLGNLTRAIDHIS